MGSHKTVTERRVLSQKWRREVALYDHKGMNIPDPVWYPAKLKPVKSSSIVKTHRVGAGGGRWG